MTSIQGILDSFKPTVQNIVKLLSLNSDEDVALLKKAACRVMAEQVGKLVYYRGLVEFSNVCGLDCLYCGIRKSNRAVKRYTLEHSEIVEAAIWCAEQGYGSLVLQSGENRRSSAIELICDTVAEIKKQTASSRLPQGLGITLSVGVQSRDVYQRFFEAGAHRYLLRIETSNEDLFKKIHPDMQTLQRRIEALKDLRDVGFQVGTGVMIGLPGQTLEQLAQDILFFLKQDIDMVGMGPYIPHKDTPMSAESEFTNSQLLQLSLNMIAVARLVLKDVNIAATTALQAIVPNGRELGLTYGANVTMPNLTPTEQRKDYQLYNGKPCVDEGRQECKGCLLGRVRSTGREVGFNQWGDSKHFADRQK